MESRILKARCKKTGQYFGIEIKNIGGIWRAVNMVFLSDEESKMISSSIRQPNFETNSNLIACPTCGNRKISGCSCEKRENKCYKDMRYRFNCIYCDSLEIDYSAGRSSGPYTSWAGISNIPDAVKDSYGNPQGSQYDLAQDGSFGGYKIIVLNLCSECDFSRPKQALTKKGFEIDEFKSMPNVAVLKKVLSDNRSQLWVISDRVTHMLPAHIELIKEYYESGHGVYIWGDNDPYYADANNILSSLFGTRMFGNSPGDRVLGIQATLKSPGIIANHPITTGIVNFYEGITIAQVETTSLLSGIARGVLDRFGVNNYGDGNVLQPLIYGSNGLLVVAYYDSNNRRALVDGGFTRLYYKWDSAGTDRYIVNAAAWLANIEYIGYYN